MEIIKRYFKKHKIVTTKAPLVIQYENPTDTVLPAIIFGFSDYLFEINYGNGKLLVTNLQTNSDKGYGRIIHESLTPYLIGSIRFQSDNVLNLEKTLKIKNKKANGFEYEIPFPLSFLKDPEKPNILDVKIKQTINSSTYMTIDIEPKSILIITIYPITEEMVSYKEYLAYHNEMVNSKQGNRNNIKKNHLFTDFIKKIFKNK